MIQKYYSDPIEVIWLHCLKQLGWCLSRSSEVFASWDGKVTLTIGLAGDLDSDDSLAQLILHELCHALIEGKRAWSKVDWGLDNIDQQHLVNELACHRLQAALADQVGLRSFFAVTTDWRPYYEQIPIKWNEPQSTKQVLQWAEAFDRSLDEAQNLDKRAILLADKGLSLLNDEQYFSQALSQALKQSASIAQILKPCVAVNSLWF